MAKFSEAEVKMLQSNVNVLHVTDEMVTFTEGFKKHAWESLNSGMRMPDIFRENGIDPEILGQKRVENFRYWLRRKAREGKGFEDNRSQNGSYPVSEKHMSSEDRIRQLEHELAYTKQEVEFLKKLQMANTEARKEWELKHRQK